MFLTDSSFDNRTILSDKTRCQNAVHSNAFYWNYKGDNCKIALLQAGFRQAMLFTLLLKQECQDMQNSETAPDLCELCQYSLLCGKCHIQVSLQLELLLQQVGQGLAWSVSYNFYIHTQINESCKEGILNCLQIYSLEQDLQLFLNCLGPECTNRH